MAEGHVAIGQNRILGTLKRSHPERMPPLEFLELTLRQELYSPNVPIEHVYFPVNGVVSMLADLDGDQMIEVATVGNEGMVGLPVFLGADSTPGRAFSQVPGSACRMSTADFKALIQEPSLFTSTLHRYTQAMMIQISQTTACNRAHNNRQRCAKWLLLTHDRVGKDEFSLTQEFLAQMLGVRRATVSEVAGQLQSEGIINYARGVIRILDRAQLEAVSCLCYRVIREEYDRMYSDVSEDL